MLTDTHVDLAPGQVLGLRGVSGSGKSTLAAVLAGIRRPDHGRVEIDGQPLAATSGPRPVQLVLQRPDLAMNPRWHIRDVLAEAAPDGLDTAIEATGLVDPGWLDRYPHEISGGELQRVNLARALLARPRYLLLDEISASLDSLTQARLWRHILDQVPSERLGVLAISHDPVLLARVADTVVDLVQLQVRPPHGGDGDDLAGPTPRRSDAR